MFHLAMMRASEADSGKERGKGKGRTEIGLNDGKDP